MPNSFEAPYTIAKRAPHTDELVMAPGLSPTLGFPCIIGA